MTDLEPWVPVFAISTARDNAELIEQCATLGYLDPEWSTIDATYGLGNFWTRFRPALLIGCDLNPAKSPIGRAVDFRPGLSGFDDNSFEVVVIDPPYKLNGTSTGEGAATSDENYGVEEYASAADRQGLQFDMLREGARLVRPARRPVPGTRRSEMVGGYVLVKGQDMVNGGKVQWTTRHLANLGESLGLRLVDMLLLPGYRPQPRRCKSCTHTEKRHPNGACAEKGCGCNEFVLDTSQSHARRNYSTLLVFRDESRWDPSALPGVC